MKKTIKAVTIHAATEKLIENVQKAYHIWMLNPEGVEMEQIIKMLVLSLPLLIFAGTVLWGCIRTAKKNEEKQRLERNQKEVAQYMEIP